MKCSIHRYTEMVFDGAYGRLICPDCNREENSFREKEWSRRMEQDGMMETEEEFYDPKG